MLTVGVGKISASRLSGLCAGSVLSVLVFVRLWQVERVCRIRFEYYTEKSGINPIRELYFSVENII